MFSGTLAEIPCRSKPNLVATRRVVFLGIFDHSKLVEFTFRDKDATRRGIMAASNSPIVRPPIDAVDWDALARLMDIPDDQRENFIWWLQNSIKGELCYATKHATKPPEKPVRRRRGAPNLDQRSDDRFASFLENLLDLVHGLGGHPSFTKRTMTGNIVDLLNALRPVMPRDFIDKGLRRKSLIERLYTKVNARADSGVPVADLIELLRGGDLWRALEEQEPMCPDCGQPAHWRKRFPISRPRLCRDCGRPFTRAQRRRGGSRRTTRLERPTRHLCGRGS
jgi:hypothetical protein